MPLVFRFFIGLTIQMVFTALNTLLVDTHLDCPSTSQAACNFVVARWQPLSLPHSMRYFEDLDLDGAFCSSEGFQPVFSAVKAAIGDKADAISTDTVYPALESSSLSSAPFPNITWTISS